MRERAPQANGYRPVREPQSPREMEGLTPEERVLLMAQRQERSSRATLVTALCILGRFEEALAITEDPARREWILGLQESDARPDDERCKCEHKVDRADYTRNENAEPRLEPGRKFNAEFCYWSPRYGGIVTKHVCVVCGFANSLPEVDLNA